LSCPFNHNPDHVAICTHYLSDSCNRQNCTLSHKPDEYNTPVCTYYLYGNCSNDDCKYTHMDVDTNAHVCGNFALQGYCEDGKKCKFKHVFECPAFDMTGKCARKHCKLKHVLRARNNHERKEENEEEGKSSSVDVPSQRRPVDINLLADMIYQDEYDDNNLTGGHPAESEPEVIASSDSDLDSDVFDNDQDDEFEDNESQLSFIRV